MKWTERALELLTSGKLLVNIIVVEGIKAARLDGECPYCGDLLQLTQPLTAITEGSEDAPGKGVATEAGYEPSLPRYEDITFICGCGVIHAGGPKKAPGCGTKFRVSVLVI